MFLLETFLVAVYHGSVLFGRPSFVGRSNRESLLETLLLPPAEIQDAKNAESTTMHRFCLNAFPSIESPTSS